MADTARCPGKEDRAADTALYPRREGDSSADTTQCPMTGGYSVVDSALCLRSEITVRPTLSTVPGEKGTERTTLADVPGELG